ncbi:MAG: sigma factor [Singulisphaera sp.]
MESRTRPSLLLAVRDPSNGRAWETFTQRYEGIIRGWCRRKGLRPEDVDEVTQVVLFKLFQEMPTFVYDPRKRFRSWLRGWLRMR